MLLKRVLSYFRLFEKGRSQSIDKYNRVDISLFKFTSNRERTLKKTHPFSLSPVDDLKILEYNRHILTKRIAQSISFLCEKGTMGFLPRFQCIVLTLPHTQREGYLMEGKDRNGCGFDHTEGSACPVGQNIEVIDLRQPFLLYFICIEAACSSSFYVIKHQL